MDVKYGIYSITPRNGKAVEINAMWYNALKIIEELSIKFKDKKRSKKYKELAEKCKKSFNEKFYSKSKKSLYDVLGDNKIRPNQLFALSLTYPVIEPGSEIAKELLETITKKLLNPYGLKTLSKEDNDYKDSYQGDSFTRDSAYHQGITWPWLLGLYYNSLKNMIKDTKDKTYKKELEIRLIEFKKDVEKTFDEDMKTQGAIGSISEIYDSKEPQIPRGAFAQCWSVAEIFRIIQGK
jgi:glycogen debranching enzyme